MKIHMLKHKSLGKVSKHTNKKPFQKYVLKPINMVLCGNHLNSYKDLTGLPMFPEGTPSLLSKTLTKEIWEELKNVTDINGFTFRQAIFTGCKNLDSLIGVYGGSLDSYRKFAPLYSKMISKYHDFK
jgi:hypothetical protein